MTLGRHVPAERVYAYEPATHRWRVPPAVYFRSLCPTCTTCGKRIAWCGEPSSSSLGFSYPVRCRCGLDVITFPVRLTVGGTIAELERRLHRRSDAV